MCCCFYPLTSIHPLTARCRKCQGSVEEEIISVQGTVHIKLVFCAREISLLGFLHQEADVVFLLLKGPLQNIKLSLTFREFHLKMMVSLLQSLTKNLYSEQQPADYQTILNFWGYIFVKNVTSPLYPPGCQMDLVGQPNTESFWRLHWGAKRAKTANQTRWSAISESDFWMPQHTPADDVFV